MTDNIALTALSPLDGRYSSQLADVSKYFSELALIQRRVEVEIAYLIFLADQKLIPQFSNLQKKQLVDIASNFSVSDAEEIKTIEQKTRHDVKAVEYFLREKMRVLEIPGEEFVHLALTSEDTNSLALGLMIEGFKKDILIPQLRELLQELVNQAEKYVETSMLARTHGQPAVPTTLGKEFLVFAYRLYEELLIFESETIKGKMSGAVGNYNAHGVVFNQVNWPELSAAFIRSLGLEPALYATQIVPAETYTRLFSSIIRINVIATDLAQDIWRYISDGCLIQKNEAEQVGSSTMPHKVNPIDFENSEGNFGLANSLLAFFIQKLPVSRLQRDLSDSTVKRNVGSAFGYACLGYRSLIKGLKKISADEKKLNADLNNHWEIISEALQVILRANGEVQGYEQLQKFLQGKDISESELNTFIVTLDIEPELQKKLLAVSPHNYTGLASLLTKQGIAAITKYLQGVI